MTINSIWLIWLLQGLHLLLQSKCTFTVLLIIYVLNKFTLITHVFAYLKKTCLNLFYIENACSD